MKKTMGYTLVASALMFPVMASAATTAELKLIGTITPVACEPVFTGGSTIDYGNILASSLSASEQTRLPDKATSLTVTCDAPVKFGFSLVDERSATAVPELNGTTSPMFGLGAAANGASIGGYWLSISNETADSGAVNRLQSTNGGTTWAAFTGNIYADGSVVGFGDGTAAAPTPHTSVAVDLGVYSFVDKTENLPITDTINIDGLATLEVKYL